MREIKFRAWLEDHDTKIPYVEHFELHEISQGSIMSRDSGFESLSYCVIEQFTGIRDKHKSEIYEGDIVVLSGTTFEVVFNETISIFCMRRKPPNKAIRFFGEDIQDMVYIIGNIHENQELLK